MSNRVIKFRVYDKKYKKMYLGGDIRCALAYPQEDIEYMQFTGVLDKNQKEIYEGDVLKTHSDGSAYILSKIFQDENLSEYSQGHIYFLKGGFQICQSVIGASHLDGYISDSCDESGLCCSDSLEIIGNIFENPELHK